MGLIVLGVSVLFSVTVFLAVIIWWVGTYNMLQRLKFRADNAWSQINNQLNIRHDLALSLAECAKTLLKSEKGISDGIVKAAERASGSELKEDEKSDAENALSEELSRFFSRLEQYPEIETDKKFSSLKEELVLTQNKLLFAVHAYNDAVTAYNRKINSFPSNIVAGTTSFKSMEMFDVKDIPELEKSELH
jgi:LemA protein